MPEVPQDWWEIIPVEAQRGWLMDALTSGNGDLLEGRPIYCKVRLSWRVEEWISLMSMKYRHSRAEVTEILLQLGRYIWEVYPKAAERSQQPYFWAVYPVDYLVSRCQSASGRAGILLMDAKSMVARAEEAIKGHQAAGNLAQEPNATENITMPREYLEASEGDQPALEGKPDDELPVVPKDRAQHLSGELVYYLFAAALQRGQAPMDLFNELGYTAIYLDGNFADENVPSLREQLLLKVMAAEQASRATDKVLSALETSLVDLRYILDGLGSQIMGMLPAKVTAETVTEGTGV